MSLTCGSASRPPQAAAEASGDSWKIALRRLLIQANLKSE